MNEIVFGVVATPPDGQGFGQVLIGGTTRRVYFHPARFGGGWATPVAGDRVALAPGTPQWHALWLIGRGAASYAFGG